MGRNNLLFSSTHIVCLKANYLKVIIFFNVNFHVI